jgi:hypothetical protein
MTNRGIGERGSAANAGWIAAVSSSVRPSGQRTYCAQSARTAGEIRSHARASRHRRSASAQSKSNSPAMRARVISALGSDSSRATAFRAASRAFGIRTVPAPP